MCKKLCNRVFYYQVEAVKPLEIKVAGRKVFNPICPSFATPDATPNKKWATA